SDGVERAAPAPALPATERGFGGVEFGSGDDDELVDAVEERGMSGRAVAAGGGERGSDDHSQSESECTHVNGYDTRSARIRDFGDGDGNGQGNGNGNS